jgi:hypothetical protein
VLTCTTYRRISSEKARKSRALILSTELSFKSEDEFSSSLQPSRRPQHNNKAIPSFKKLHGMENPIERLGRLVEVTGKSYSTLHERMVLSKPVVVIAESSTTTTTRR